MTSSTSPFLVEDTMVNGINVSTAILRRATSPYSVVLIAMSMTTKPKLMMTIRECLDINTLAPPATAATRMGRINLTIYQ